MDTADSLPPPALDKVGGIVAAIVFGLCFLALTWQWLRHKFHPFAVISLFLLLRTIGWLVASIGAIQGDSGLNKRGYILNAILFWLMALGAMLLLVRWNVCRRGKSWNKLAWSAVGLVTIPCLVLGALDVAGQIYWLDNPSGDPPTTLKVASVGFLVLTGAYGLASLAFAFREQFVYQRPLVRLSFVLSGLFLILRCICWMVVSLNISRFSGKNRLIFLYCTATIFEMLVAIVWSTTPLATNLKLPKHDNLPDLPSLKVVDDSVAHPSRTQGSSAPTNNEPSRPSNLNAVFERDEDDSEGEEHELEQVAAVPATTQYVVNPVGHNSYNMPTANVAPNSNSYGSPQPGYAPNSNSYGSPQPGYAPNTNSYGSPQLGYASNSGHFGLPQSDAALGRISFASYPDNRYSGASGGIGVPGAYYNSTGLTGSHEMNTWTTPTTVTGSPAISDGYSPRVNSYMPQTSLASMQIQTTPILPQNSPHNQQIRAHGAQPAYAPNPTVSFSALSQSPNLGGIRQHPAPARTPYPAMAVNPHQLVSFADASQPAFTADYFNSNDVSPGVSSPAATQAPPSRQPEQELPGDQAETQIHAEPQTELLAQTEEYTQQHGAEPQPAESQPVEPHPVMAQPKESSSPPTI